jgi:hypothetical protein
MAQYRELMRLSTNLYHVCQCISQDLAVVSSCEGTHHELPAQTVVVLVAPIFPPAIVQFGQCASNYLHDMFIIAYSNPGYKEVKNILNHEWVIN